MKSLTNNLCCYLTAETGSAEFVGKMNGCNGIVTFCQLVIQITERFFVDL